MKKLILFTASFPYGKKETYLETEIKYLSRSFDSIHIYPHYYNNKDTSQRKMPENVFINKAALSANKLHRLATAIKGLVTKSHFFFLDDFIRKKVYKSKVNFKTWFFEYVNYLATIASDEFKCIENEENSIFYYYWGAGWANTLPHLNKTNKNNNTIFMRVHGSEVYLERSNGYIPVRENVFERVNFFLPISNHLSSYLKDHYKIHDDKRLVSRLGTLSLIKSIRNQTNNQENFIKIVSCSNMISLKRIDLIIDSLFYLDGIEINWIHFGDGPLMQTLQKKVKLLSFKTISITFKGRVDNKNILLFYKNNKIDAFINVSKFEGLPVSIMEAMSFSIPCIATNAGATSEIVNNDNGILLPNNLSILELSNSIMEISNVNWNGKRENAYDTWHTKFNAEYNYKNLVKMLISNI